MIKSRKNRHKAKTGSTLMITPMIDMFTVILIFLIVSYAPEQSKIKMSEQIEVPKSSIKLSKVPKLQVEVTDSYVMINGEAVDGLNPKNRSLAQWKGFLKRVQELKSDEETVLILSDKRTNFENVDRTVAHLAKAGYSEVYFLTENEEEKEIRESEQEGN